MLPILSLPGLVRLFLCRHRQTVIAGASARRQAPLPTEHAAHRPDRMGLGCWGGWHGWYAVPCRCDIRLRLDISCCDQRGLYGDSAYDGPVVRVGSMVGHGQLTSGLSRSCSISKFTCCRAPAGHLRPLSGLACHHLPTAHRAVLAGCMRSSTMASACRGSCQSAWAPATAPVVQPTGSSSRTRRHLQSSGRQRRTGAGGAGDDSPHPASHPAGPVRGDWA